MSGRCGILGCGKGRSEGLSRKIELDRILMSFDVLNVPKDIRVLILEALNSDKWDWFKAVSYTHLTLPTTERV